MKNYFISQSGTTIRITNKIHLHLEGSDKDTICSKNFAFPDINTVPVSLNEEGFIEMSGNVIEDDFMCNRCIQIFKIKIS